MQTFLPYACFERSAQVLDPVRRWKQCVEARQLVAALERGPLTAYAVAEKRFRPDLPVRVGPGLVLRKTPWYNHPACVMWREFVPALRLYFNHMMHRVIVDRTHRVIAWGMYDLRTAEERRPPMPPWFGQRRFHAAHRSNLLRKNPAYYGAFNWAEPPTLGYWWPTSEIFPRS